MAINIVGAAYKNTSCLNITDGFSIPDIPHDIYIGAELGGIQPSLLNRNNNTVHATDGAAPMLLNAKYPTEPTAVVAAVPVKGPTIMVIKADIATITITGDRLPSCSKTAVISPSKPNFIKTLLAANAKNKRAPVSPNFPTAS